MIAPATSFGRYELLSRLASGGMGEVWLAHLRGASGFEKRVVIKIMLPHVADNPKLVDMFVAEASVAAQLSHPNIIQIYELGVVDGRYFIAMEYVAGRSLRQIGHQLHKLGRRMPIWFLLAVIGKTCHGLHYAHELCGPDGRPLGLAHRDISPENIMVSFTGDVKLIDFGALRVTTGNTHPASRREDLVGKFSYMAPEQVRGVPASRRTDLYSVGEVLYEYLTGERPYEAPDEASLLHKVARGELIDPAQLAPHLPRELLDILRKVLAYDPKQRWSDAADLAEALLGMLGRANLPFDQASLGRFVATTFPDATDVPKVVQQELARRVLPDRDLAVPAPPLVGRAGRRHGESEASIQIEVHESTDAPTRSSVDPGTLPEADDATIASDSPAAATANTRAVTSRERPEPPRERGRNTPAVLAAALPGLPRLPPIPRPQEAWGAAARSSAIDGPPPPTASDAPAAPAPATSADRANELRGWPLASPNAVVKPPELPPLSVGAEGTADESPALATDWPVFARPQPRRAGEGAAAHMFESAPPLRPDRPGRPVPLAVDVFSTRTPRQPEDALAPVKTREVASLFAAGARAATAALPAFGDQAWSEAEEATEQGALASPTTPAYAEPAIADARAEVPPARGRAWSAARRPSTEVERLFDRGIALLAAHDFEQALAQWEKAHELAPDNGKVRSNLRRLRKKLGRE